MTENGSGRLSVIDALVDEIRGLQERVSALEGRRPAEKGLEGLLAHLRKQCGDLRKWKAGHEEHCRQNGREPNRLVVAKYEARLRKWEGWLSAVEGLVSRG